LTNAGWSAWGPSLFGFSGFGPYFLPGVLEGGAILPEPLVRSLLALSATVIAPFLLGLAGALGEVWRRMKTGAWTGREFLSACAILVVVTEWTLFRVTGLVHHPHYAHGGWFAFFYLLWRGWEWALARLGTLAKVLLGFQIGATGMLLWVVIVFIHLSGGIRGIHYGPTLSNQITVVKTVLQHSPRSLIRNGVEHYDLFPMAFGGLLRLLNFPEDKREKPIRCLTLLQEEDPRWFWIRVFIDPHPGLSRRGASIGPKGIS
jgi:hypothetical protein